MINLLFVAEILEKGFVGIFLLLDCLIYGLIASAFKIFIAISKAQLLSSTAYTEIANKIYVIIGVVMLFVLSYAILKAIIDPDKESKGDLGSKMLGRIITAVIGLAITPFLFNFMYQLQGKILEDDILGKIFFRIESNETIDGTFDYTDENGKNTSYGESNVNPDKYINEIGGAVTAVNLWQAFFYPNPDLEDNSASSIEADASEFISAGIGYGILCAAGMGVGIVALNIPVVGWLVGGALIVGSVLAGCINSVNSFSAGDDINKITNGDGKITLEEAYQYASATGDFGLFPAFINNYIDDGEIKYIFVISTVAGAFALYAFVSFSIDMGIRAAMLAYLQIIAPVPLALQVLPKFKDNLNKYITKVIGTFMEVFIRISVVYVVVYIICHLTELFGSVSTWSQNSGLDTVEKVFALALLILGLIAFCRKAPEIISETLNLPKGNMSLGIGKKLADGGFYGAKSIAGSGIKSAVNAWNNVKPRKGASRPSLNDRVGAAMSGLGLGTARAIKSNYIGPDHKEAKNAKEAKAISEKTAEGVGASLQKKYDRLDTKDRYNKLQSELGKLIDEEEAKMNDMSLPEAARLEAKAKMEQAIKDKKEAKAKYYANTMVAAAVKDLENKTKAWAVGTVDTSREEAVIKFGNSLDALKGNLREEAYKKDTFGAKKYKQEYDDLQSEELKLYKEGYDETSANEELRRRIQLMSNPNSNLYKMTEAFNKAKEEFNKVKDKDITDAGYITAGENLFNAKKALELEINQAGFSSTMFEDDKCVTNLTAAIAEFNRVKNLPKVNVTDPIYIKAQADFEQAKLEFNNALNTGTLSNTWHTDTQVKVDISDIKISEVEARNIKARRVEAARQKMEAAAEAWVLEQSLDEKSNTFRDVQKFLSDHADFINHNQNTELVINYDKNGNPIYQSVSDILNNGFGAGAINGKFTPKVGQFSPNVAMEVELNIADPAIASNNKTKVTYRKVKNPNGAVAFVPYDSDGNEIKNSTINPEYTEAEFFDRMDERIVKQNVSKVSAKTSLTNASDIGKIASRHVANNDLAEKIQRKRKQEDAKK